MRTKGAVEKEDEEEERDQADQNGTITGSKERMVRRVGIGIETFHS